MEIWRFTLLVIISSLTSTQQINANCVLTNLPKIDSKCAASLECSGSVSLDRTTWGCIKSDMYVRDRYSYYGSGRSGHYETVYANDFYLNVSVLDTNDEKDIFESFSYKKNVVQLKITDGSITAIPQTVLQLDNVDELVIAGNSISELDLNSFSEMQHLKSIVLKNNGMVVLRSESQNKKSALRSLINLDLSQNLLDSIPATSFSLFTNMQNLNLSHNLIKEFGILTFEGIIELKTLDVSHNMLFEIGNSLTRFMNLKTLYIQENKLTKIYDHNLSTLLKVQTLNLSYNLIETIENNAFKNNLELKYLDLRHNKLKLIKKDILETNNKLQSFLISYNNIDHIEDGTFNGKKIIEFDFRNNNLTGLINEYTFKGVLVDTMDLSNGSITKLGENLFTQMQNDLKAVNFSYNEINNISQSSFTSLKSLQILDLSHNKINEVNFITSDLKNITSLYLQNNLIKKLTSNTFQNLLSLKYLDLSHNNINVVESKSFKDLNMVQTLKITHNPFINVLENNTFKGLVNLMKIDLSFVRTNIIKNISFSGLPNLINVNSSHGQLTQIEYNSFIETGSIEIIDLSRNLLESFHVNISSIENVQEIYLNDNALGNIANYTFSGLQKLRILVLDRNNILKIEFNAFKDVQQLSQLSLSANTQLEIMGNPFKNLTQLFKVNLNNVRKYFTFQNKSMQIVNLNLNSCGIKDLNKVFVFNINKLRELDLSLNEIETIDKFSLQNLDFLTHLDLSSNRINYIQPGSFLHVSDLRVINLYGNNIQSLQFGVFDGIVALNYVNLSNNAIEKFDIKLLPTVLNLGLDSNNIKNLAFKDFFENKINKLSIGGNLISCEVLVDLKNSEYSYEFKNVVTSAKLDFHSENVDGITCVSNANDKTMIMPAINNKTVYDIRPVFKELTNAIKDLRALIENQDKHSARNKSHENQSELTNLVSSIQLMINVSQEAQNTTNGYLKETDNYIKLLGKASNNSEIYFKQIIRQMLNLTANKNATDSNIIETIVDSSKESDDIRLEMKKMVKDEIEAIREEFSKSFQKSGTVTQARVFEKEIKDDKILYFIAASVGVFVVIYILNMVYKFVRNRNNVFSHNRHGSIRPIVSEIELE